MEKSSGDRHPPRRTLATRANRRTEGVAFRRPARRVGGATAAVRARIAGYAWDSITAHVNTYGNAVLPKLLAPEHCRQLASLYADERHFRSHIHMARYGFGLGEYRYFKYPLPTLVAQLRTRLFAPLAVIANDWNERLRVPERYPTTHASFLRRCHEAGQIRPTPLLLRYVAGDFNCLHQDVYGARVFPLQLTILLSNPGEDFRGGEFVLTEQRPRRQTRTEVVPLDQGDAVIFAVRHRPIQGARGAYRANLRHGVSRIRSGTRLTLGIIFHDAL